MKISRTRSGLPGIGNLEEFLLKFYESGKYFVDFSSNLMQGKSL
jgi:hypothetical protein